MQLICDVESIVTYKYYSDLKSIFNEFRLNFEETESNNLSEIYFSVTDFILIDRTFVT